MIHRFKRLLDLGSDLRDSARRSKGTAKCLPLNEAHSFLAEAFDVKRMFHGQHPQNAEMDLELELIWWVKKGNSAANPSLPATYCECNVERLLQFQLSLDLF